MSRSYNFINETDYQGYQDYTNQTNTSEKQYGVIFDLVSAGEIQGLVGGLSGIYLNGTALVDRAEYDAVRSKIGTANVSGTAVSSAAGLFTGVDLAKGDRYLLVRGGGPTASLASSMAAGSSQITVNTSIFTSAMALNFAGVGLNQADDHVGTKIRIPGAGVDGKEYVGAISGFVSGTVATISPPISTAVSSGTIVVDTVHKISSITNNNTAVLATAVTNSVSGGLVRLSASLKYYNQKDQGLAYDNTYAAFRRGTRYQQPITAMRSYGAPSASYIIAPGTDLKWYAGDGTTTISSLASANATTIQASAFNFGQNVKTEIDRLTIGIEFPAGLKYVSPKGNDGPAGVEFQIILNYKKSSSQSSFTKDLIYGKDYGGSNFINGVGQPSNTNSRSNTYSWVTNSDFDHQDQIDGFFAAGAGGISRVNNGTIVKKDASSSFIADYVIDLSKYQPLHDWNIEIRRITPDNSTHYNPTVIDNVKASFTGIARVKTVEAAILDKFSYPTSAYAAVSFSAEDFSSPPTRSYHIQGRKIKVPANYITREERANQQALYTRNQTTGADTGTYQAWNGSFRGDETLAVTHANFRKVYTNNPAWIFYDILTDKEFGLGEFVQESDIDKFALFSIARYCDELVPNGKGGTEPRFTCNVYIANQQEAFKVVKDLASTFRAMMYWIDGQVATIQDAPKEPVYTFTTGNVENGIFNYTYTGEKARANQINVTWNNPDEFYKQTILTIEDTANIEKVGRIIPASVVAFGCTSEGQARRLADWHLATSTKETEVVSFTTGLNAAFLRPGDIVNVQDKRQYNIESSGRVGAGSDTNTIVLDRTVTAPGGANLGDCNLYLIYTEPGVYLTQDSATINSVAYTRGQLLLENASGGAIATQAQAANLVDDSGNAVSTHFSENSRVEVKSINGSATTGTSASTISILGAFSSAPQQDTIWAISREDDVNTNDLKEFRILGIAQTEENKYEITASKYIKDKYDEIDVDQPIQTYDYIPLPKRNDPVPAPRNLSIEQVRGSSVTKDGEGTQVKVKIAWSTPTEDLPDTNSSSQPITYRFLSHFEIHHNMDLDGNANSRFTKITNIPGNATTFSINNVDAGTYTVKIRAVNILGNYSEWQEITREIFSIAPGTSRIARVQRGGFLTFSPEINATTGLVSIDATAYRYIHPSGEEYIFNPASTTQLEQSFSTLPSGQTAFWFFDASNTADPWKRLQLHTDTTATDSTGNASNFNYLKGIGAPTNGLSAASGTVTVASGSTEVTGSGTAFTTDYYVGGFIKISALASAGTETFNSEYREVVEIESNTKLFVRNPFTRGFTGQNPMKQQVDVRFQDDAILAEITNSSGTFSAEFFVQGKGAGGSDTVKTVHVFRSGTKPGSPPVPTSAEMGRDPIDGDFVTVHYTDGNISFIHDGSSFSVKTTHVDGAEVLAATVTGSKVASATITGSNIAGTTITGANIASATITGAKIDSATITGSNMVGGTITGTQIANSTITGSKIAAATIVDANIASGTITGARIASSTISNSLLLDNTIQGGKIALATIQGGNIATNTITANNITVTSLSSLSANIGAISSGSLQGGTIPDANGAPSGSETGSFFDLTLGRFVVGNATNYVLWNGTSLVIGGNVIASGNIQSNAVTQAKIASAAVGANEIAALAVERAKIADNAINANKIASGAVTATEIAANTITANQLTTGSFVTSSANISDGIITNAKIGSLDAGKITSGQIDAARINVGSIVIGNLSGASSFKGALSNLNNPSSQITPTDDTAAAAAQSTANTAVTNAATAQSTANTGVANAATAQSTANTGVANAATAQSTANTAVTNAATAQSTANSKVAPSEVANHIGGANTTTISGGVITTGTLNGSLVNVTNLNAGNISAGTLNADRIAANSISFSKINDVTFTAGQNGNLGLGTNVLASLNTSGDIPVANVAMGYITLQDVTAGDFNSAYGFLAGNNITTGDSNTALGYISMAAHTTGNYNTYVGGKAGQTTSDYHGNVNYNVLLGYSTAGPSGNASYLGYGVSIGSFAQVGRKGGIAIGYDAYTAYHNSICIGYSSESTGNVGTSSQGNIVLGSNIHATGTRHILIGCINGTRTDSNSIRIGTGSHSTVLIGDGDVASASDSRDKIDIKDISLGLNLVKTLSAKSFIYNHRENYTDHTVIDNVIDETLARTFTIENTPVAGTLYVKHNFTTLELNTDYTFSNKTITLKDSLSLEKGDDVQIRYDTFDTAGYESASKKHPYRTLGWVAQDAKTAVENLTSEELNIVNSEDEEYLKFSPMQLIPVLWKAVQELSDKNDALEARIATLEGG